MSANLFIASFVVSDVLCVVISIFTIDAIVGAIKPFVCYTTCCVSLFCSPRLGCNVIVVNRKWKRMEYKTNTKHRISMENNCFFGSLCCWRQIRVSNAMLARNYGKWNYNITNESKKKYDANSSWRWIDVVVGPSFFTELRYGKCFSPELNSTASWPNVRPSTQTYTNTNYSMSPFFENSNNKSTGNTRHLLSASQLRHNQHTIVGSGETKGYSVVFICIRYAPAHTDNMLQYLMNKQCQYAGWSVCRSLGSRLCAVHFRNKHDDVEMWTRALL